ncbi:MAG: SDR family NAD(P)-dependent oxidoreductase [Firmicutes bacterium]|nr:SDR family NAD(P)-dependent oxidoreductase [Bacillota bacterium]
MNKKRVAIVTGASSGLGREFVKLLVRRKTVDEVWAIARNKDKLNNMKKTYGKKIKILSMDLSNVDEIKKFHKFIRNEKPEISFLINSAGFAKFGSYNDITIAETVNMIELNIVGVVVMGLICIPFMKKGSHIINISSQAAFQPLPYQNVYSSTKAFVRNYSRALNEELKSKGISVTAACPGWMDTALYARAETGAVRSPKNFVGMTNPKNVAVKAVRDAESGFDMSVYGAYVKMCHMAAKFLPQKVMMKIWLAQQNIH